jgi:hypothetical protein
LIVVDEEGRPIPKPERAEFPEGAEGDVEYLRVFHAWRDRVAGLAVSGFNRAWREATRPRR